MPERRKASAPETQVALRALNGAVCIYKEKTFIRLVRVASIVVDDWGAEFTFDLIPAPGFGRDAPTPFEASGAWEVLGVSERSIFATWASWVLVVRSDLVEQITSFAPEARDDLDLMNRVNELAYGGETE